MSIAIYPGTFDPPTLGHLDIIERASKHFSKLYVAIGKNSAKDTPVFSISERIFLLKTITKNIKNVEIIAFDGLLVDFANSKNTKLVIRAIRTIYDFESETLQAQVNRKIGGLETVYFSVDEKYRLVSSTLVREIGKWKKKLSGFVPTEIEQQIIDKLSKNVP